MTKKEIDAYLRSRVKTAPIVKRSRMPKPEPKRPDRAYNTWPMLLQGTEVKEPKKWLLEGDSKPVETLREKHRHDVTPLTKIAQQLPRKLPRIT